MSHRLWQSTLHLIIFGFIAKVLATIAKIVTTRYVGLSGMGNFSLVSPLMLVLISLAQFGLPTAVSKLVASDAKNRKNYGLVAFFLSMVFGFSLMLLQLFFAPWMAEYLFQNPKTLSTLYALAFLPPLVSISGLLRGYLIGIGQIEASAHSQITEEIGRFLFILSMSPLIISNGDDFASGIAMTSLLIGEIFQIFHLTYSLVRNHQTPLKKIHESIQKLEKASIRPIMAIALPMTSGRLIGSITYFLEPVILTIGLKRLGYSSETIAMEYGILVSYAMPLLLMPGFFAGSFASVLLPALSKSYSQGLMDHSRKLFVYFVGASGLVGLLFALVSFLYPTQLLQFLFGITEGAEEVKFLAFPFVFYYIEAPINSAMHALGLDKLAFRNSLIANAIRLLVEATLVTTFTFRSVSISTILSVVVIVLLNLKSVIHRLFWNHQPAIR